MRKLVEFLKSRSDLWYEFCTEIENSHYQLILKLIPEKSIGYCLHIISFFVIYSIVSFGMSYLTFSESLTHSSFEEHLKSNFLQWPYLAFTLYAMLLGTVNFTKRRNLFNIENLLRAIPSFFKWIIIAGISYFFVTFVICNLGFNQDIINSYLEILLKASMELNVPLLGVFYVRNEETILENFSYASYIIIFLTSIFFYSTSTFYVIKKFCEKKNCHGFSEWWGVNSIFSVLVVLGICSGFIKAIDSNAALVVKSFEKFTLAFILHIINVIIMRYRIEKIHRENLNQLKLTN